MEHSSIERGGQRTIEALLASSRALSVCLLEELLPRKIGVSKDAPLPDGLLPTLHGGRRVDHLSIPLEPRSRGMHAGRLWIHLTYQDGHREEVATPSPEEILLVHDEDFLEVLNATFKTRKPMAYRVTQSKLHRMVEDACLVGTDILEHPELNPDEPPDAPLVAACLGDEAADAPNLFLMHYEQGPDGNGPGWFAWPTTWLPQDFIAELLNPAFGFGSSSSL